MTIDEEWEALAVTLKLTGECSNLVWSKDAYTEFQRLFKKEGIDYRRNVIGSGARFPKVTQRYDRIQKLRKRLGFAPQPALA